MTTDGTVPETDTGEQPERTPLFVNPRMLRRNFLKHFVAAVVVMVLSGLVFSGLWQILQPTLTSPYTSIYYDFLFIRMLGSNAITGMLWYVVGQIASGFYCAVGSPAESLLYVVENLSRVSFIALRKPGWIYPIYLFSGLVLLALACAFHARRNCTSPQVMTRRLLLPISVVALNTVILLCINIARQEADRFTLLHSAAYHGQMTRARILLWFGADVNAGTKMNNATPIEMALLNKHYELARYLFSKGAYIDERNPSKYGALHHGVACDFDVFKWLVESGANLSPTPKGGSALVLASYYGHIDHVKCLLEHGVAIDECDSNKGPSALQAAVDSEHFEMARYLLENGANPNNNNSPRDTLSMAKSDEMRQLLLSYGAVPSATAGAEVSSASRETR